MKKRRILWSIITLFIGFAICLLSGGILSYIDPGTELNKPKKFGNVKIWIDEAVRAEDRETYDISKMMLITKDNIPFAAVSMDKAGEVKAFSLLMEKDKKGRIFFTMTASAEPGKWERGIYGGGGADYTTGEMYVDINVDSRFDTKNIFDDTGEKISREIYIDQIWKQVDHCDYEHAKSDETMYVFDEDSGWQVLNNEE